MEHSSNKLLIFSLIIGRYILAIGGIFFSIYFYGIKGMRVNLKPITESHYRPTTYQPIAYRSAAMLPMPDLTIMPEFASQRTHIDTAWNKPLIRQKTTELAPIVVPILRQYGLPAGLFWLMVAEDNTFSSGNPWQLSPEVAKDGNCPPDKLGDLRYSTPAAALYLKFLYKRYQDWNRVIAAWNWGYANVDTSAYFPLTSRNLIARVAALPEIIGNTGIQTPAYQFLNFSSRFTWPTTGPIITSHFHEPRIGYIHQGLDIDGNMGVPILAAAAGRIEKVIYSNSGHGNHIIIDHGNGYKTLYGHASRIDVREGDYVSQGQTIAGIGNSGKTYSRNGGDATHLHFEVWTNGKTQNPESYLNGNFFPLLASGTLPADYPRYLPPQAPPKLPQTIDPKIALVLAKMNI